MDFFDDIKTNKSNILIISIIGNIILIIALIIVLYLYFTKPCVCDECTSELAYSISNEEEEKEDKKKEFYVEIKGAVENPGVYKVSENNIINDIVNLAGGLKENAYTDNINLSKKVEEELVIYLYTKDEFNKNTVDKIDNNFTCVCPTYDISSCTNDLKSEIVTDDSPDDNPSTPSSKEEAPANVDNVDTDILKKKININIATASELTKLTGIGDSKAQKIVDYRNSHGGFKSIDEIKNVSGIGDAIFAKIKDNITV